MQTPEIGRHAPRSLPHHDDSLEFQSPRENDEDSNNRSLIRPSSAQGTTHCSFLDEPKSSDLPQDSFNASSDLTETQFQTTCSVRPCALEMLSVADISARSTQEANHAIRTLSQAVYADFFHNLRCMAALQHSNFARASNDIPVIEASIRGKEREVYDGESELKQASEALEAAEAAQEVAEVKALNNQRVLEVYETDSLEEDVRLAMSAAYQIAQRYTQSANEAVEATESAAAEKRSCEESVERTHQEICTLRQELSDAARVHEDCKATGSVLEGHMRAVACMTAGPKFPQITSKVWYDLSSTDASCARARERERAGRSVGWWQ